MITKGYLVGQAVGELGIAAYLFDLTPDEINDCLNRLDAMMAGWSFSSAMGYIQPANPNTSVGTDNSGLSADAAESVISNLAVRIASMWGKAIPPEKAAAAMHGYGRLYGKYKTKLQVARPVTQPTGAGNKPHQAGQNYFQEEAG